MKLWLFFLFLTLGAAHAATQESAAVPETAPAASATTAGINITADALEFRDQEKIYLAQGNATVEQKGTTINADKITAHYTEESGKTIFTTLVAEGHVHIINAKGEVFGDRGVYDVAREVAVLRGANLKLMTPTDEVHARDSLEYWQKERLVVARGAAKATRGDNIITADTLTGLLHNNAQGNQEMQRVNADGHVTITTATDIVQGDKGLYDVPQQRAQLEGNVRIKRGQTVLMGNRAEVNMATGISRLLAKSGQRVRGLIIPKDAPQVP